MVSTSWWRDPARPLPLPARHQLAGPYAERKPLSMRQGSANGSRKMGRRGGGGELLGVGEVAKLLRVSTARVRQLRLAGRFIKEATVISGRRLYRRADVEQFKKSRTKRKG